MMLVVCSVYDAAVKAFLPPFASRHIGEAVRSFASACEDSTHQFAKFSTDFTLFRLGEWDDATGMFHPETSPVVLARASQYSMVGETVLSSKLDESPPRRVAM